MTAISRMSDAQAAGSEAVLLRTLRTADPLSALLKCLYSESCALSSCHYLFFSQKKTELQRAGSRAASCKAAGKELCHSVPCRCDFIHLSVSVFPLQLSPLSRSLSIWLPTLALCHINKRSTNSPRMSRMKSIKRRFKLSCSCFHTSSTRQMLQKTP